MMMLQQEIDGSKPTTTIYVKEKIKDDDGNNVKLFTLSILCLIVWNRYTSKKNIGGVTYKQTKYNI